MRRIWHAIRQRRLDDELVEEMEFHRAMLQRELESRGSDPADAVVAARRTFGSVALAADRSRDVWISTWRQDAWRDLRFGSRLLTRERSFAALAIVTLGLAIGVDNTLFIAINAACLRGLPIARADRVLIIGTKDARERDLGLSWREFDKVRQVLPAFAGVAAFSNAQMAVAEERHAPDRELGTFVSADAFRLLRESPALGRDFRSEDDAPGAGAVVILSHGLWQRRYAGDPAMVGRTIRVNAKPATVIGVMRDPFQFPGNAELWLPMVQNAAAATSQARTLTVIGRLTDQTALSEARAELSAAGSALAHDFPESNQGVRMTAVPINERYMQKITDPSWIAFLGLGLIVVLIACANVANLLLMRGMRRAHEMATRASLGATRSHLVRQLLVESTIIAASGGVLGWVVAVAGERWLQGMIPASTIPYWNVFTMDRRTLLFLFAVCGGTVLVFGLVPALHVARADVNQALKSGGRGGTSGVRERRWTTAFLVAEFGLTLMFMAGLVVNLRAMIAAQRADLIIRTEGRLTAWLSLSPTEWRTPAQRLNFYRRLDERVRAATGVSAVAMMTALPLGGGAPKEIEIDGLPAPPTATRPTVLSVIVSPQAFEVVGVPVLAGRGFDERDGATGQQRVIVNQRFVQMFLGGLDPLGRRIKIVDAARLVTPGLGPGGPLRGTSAGSDAFADAPWQTITGIVPSVRQRAPLIPDPVVYLPLQSAAPPTVAIVVKGSGDPAVLAPVLRQALQGIDPNLPLYRVMSMDRALDESQWAARGSIAISLAIVWVAIGLAAVGLYAVTAHSVVQRSHEIGVRIALGAATIDVVRLMVRRVCVQVGLGIVTGIAITTAWERAFTSVQGEYNSGDPASLMGAAVIFALVAAVSTFAPLKRATHVDPVSALRYE
ncbi:MAG: ADOP family duplicated permease [Vicinamibacterales bacterium]